MNSYPKILKIIAIISFIVGAVSCKAPIIKPSDNMKYMREVYEGDELALEWNFSNATLVRIDGINGEFQPAGATIVKPEKSHKYRIVAFRGKKDSLVCYVNVDVLARDDAKSEIRTGDIVLHEKFNSVSETESEYIAGIINEEQSDGASSLKISRFKIDTTSKNAIADVLLIDKNGNFVTGLGRKPGRVVWNATNLCGGITANYSNLDFRELGSGIQNENLDLFVLIENSKLAKYTNLDQSLLGAISGLKVQDNFGMASFSEEYTSITGLMPAEQAVLGFNETFKVNGRKGFAATYDAMVSAIDGLSSGTSTAKILVLLAHSNDNASLKTSAEDVINSAKAKGISVYVIGIGDGIAAYEYRDICSSTGGRFYLLLPDESDKAGDIISEIIFSIRNCYRISIPFQSFNRNCMIRSSTIQYVDSRRDLSATITIPEQLAGNTEMRIYACGFTKNSITIANEYYSNLNRIADWLKSNLDRITITGYGHNEGPPGNIQRLAQLRAEVVKNYLIERGVQPSRFLIKSNQTFDGYFPENGSDENEALNRIVLLSFSGDTKQTFELIVETTSTEEQAGKLSMDWEKKGYKAYFIRGSDMSKLYYQVRLWGFATKPDAEKAAQNIKNKYKINPVVE